MKKRVADVITEILVENNIDICFSVVGGGSMHLNNAFALNNKIEKIFNHHEQACSMAAEAYARTSGNVACVCVTSGPGGLNTVTGVEGAWVDSIPMVVISGHPRYETTVAATGLNLRCRGVQEFNIIDSVRNMTKYAKIITNPLRIKYELQKAIDIAKTGRKGPVWLDIPLNVQSALIEGRDFIPARPIEQEYGDYSELELSKLIDQIEKAKRPCLLTGSGLRTSGTVNEFRDFANRLGVPVVGGALQADIMPSTHKFYFGMSGNIGPRAGNFIIQNADLIIIFGNSLSTKQTGFNVEKFAPNAKLIMIDISKDEGEKPDVSVNQLINIDLVRFFNVIKPFTKKINVDQNWLKYCNDVLLSYPPFKEVPDIYDLEPNDRVPASTFWKVFMEKAPDDAAIALGNSSNNTGLLQGGIKHENQQVIVNYNCGSMGDDLPEAIGMSIALNQKHVYCVTGDGSVMMNLQELQTIKHNKLPIKIVIFSNDGYGAIRQTFKNHFNGLNTGCDNKSGISFPNFGKVSNAFDINYHHCSKVRQLKHSIDWLLTEEESCILEIDQKLDDPIIPRVMSKMNDDGVFETPGLHDMYPHIDEEEMNKLMCW